MDDLALVALRVSELRARFESAPSMRLVREHGEVALAFALVALGAYVASWSELLALTFGLSGVRFARRAWPAVLALVLGLLWGRATWLVAFTPLVISAWWWSRSRVEAGAVGALYHFAAARDTVEGAARYLSASWVAGLVVVAACALVLGAVWALCWAPKLREASLGRASARFALLIVASQLPPFGVLAVASPLSAAGTWFTGLGWFGLTLTVGVMLLSRVRWGVAATVACALMGAARFVPPSSPDGFLALETNLEAAQGLEDFVGQLTVAEASIAAAEQQGRSAHMVVLPESAGGLWQRTMQRVWSPYGDGLAARGQVALVGAALPRADGGWDNVVVGLGAWRGVYRQRIPVPVAMWRPWSRASFSADWFGPGVIDVGATRIGVLVCWEAGLAWPIVSSIAQGADVLVGTSNLAWFSGRTVWRAQRQTLESWAALFDMPVLLAANVEGGLDA